MLPTLRNADFLLPAHHILKLAKYQVFPFPIEGEPMDVKNV